MSNSLWPIGLKHTRLPCSSPSLGAHSNLCPLSRWCHPTISSSIVPFSYCPQSFPGSRSFPMSQLFASGVQSTRASASASVLSMNIQDWLPLELTVSISLLSKEFSKSLLHYSSKASILSCSAFFIVQLSHSYMTTGKTIFLIIQTFVGNVMCLLFSMLSRFVIAFPPRSKHLLISWLAATVHSDFGAQESKVCHCFLICHEVMEPMPWCSFFWILSFKPTFSLSSFTFIKRLFSSSSLSDIMVV